MPCRSIIHLPASSMALVSALISQNKTPSRLQAKAQLRQHLFALAGQIFRKGAEA